MITVMVVLEFSFGMALSWVLEHVSPCPNRNPWQAQFIWISFCNNTSVCSGSACKFSLYGMTNARPHRANIVNEYLEEEDITCLEWSAFYSNLNTIEHVWDTLGRRIAACIINQICLFRNGALIDDWHCLPQEQLNNLVLSNSGCSDIVLTVLQYMTNI